MSRFEEKTWGRRTPRPTRFSANGRPESACTPVIVPHVRCVSPKNKSKNLESPRNHLLSQRPEGLPPTALHQVFLTEEAIVQPWLAEQMTPFIASAGCPPMPNGDHFCSLFVCLMIKSPVNSFIMRLDKQRYRWLSRRLPSQTERRLVVLTGARQTGKTTLVRHVWPQLRYVNLDAIEEREALRALRTTAWGRTVGDAILDEAQKEPSIFDKVKFAYDDEQISFTALLGSSRLFLLDRIRESLAGRAFLFELWPLMPSEIRSLAENPPERPLLDRLIVAKTSLQSVLEAESPVCLGAEEDARQGAIEHLETWGGMPELLFLSPETRREWLRSYLQTFLERDLLDLVRLNDLQPFRTLQMLAMLRTGQLLSYSELGRDAQLATATVRRYLEYLRRSYQAFLLPPYHVNLTSTVVKSPKLYWADLGMVRQATGQWGPSTGAMFETLVISEIHKWVHTLARDTRMFFYRTRSGLEVDLLLETPRGIIGVEIKSRLATARDARNLITVAAALGKRWLGGLVVCRGGSIAPLVPETSIWRVPIHRLL